MLQQLDMEDEIITTTLIPTTTTMEETTTTEIITTTTTLHPHAIPLPFAFAPLQAITDHTHENVILEHYILEGDQIKIQLCNYGLLGTLEKYKTFVFNEK